MSQLKYAGEIRRFILGGNATFTVVEDDVRFTYKVKSGKKDATANWSTGNADKSMYFVSVLNGPSNESDYAYMGLLREDKVNGGFGYARTLKSRVNSDAPSHLIFARFWHLLENGCRLPAGLEFWHEGQCCVCGRKLTVPESIEKGIGPECEGGA